MKEALQAEAGLPINPDIPVFGFIGRLEEQKGSDILAEAVPEILKDDVQVIILVWCPWTSIPCFGVKTSLVFKSHVSPISSVFLEGGVFISSIYMYFQ